MNLLELAAAFGALVAVGAALYYLFKWKPGTKPWCVVLYHVSRDTNAQFNWPGPNGNRVNELDLKLDEVIGTLDKLPCAGPLAFIKTKLLGVSAAPGGVDWEDVHVVYRAVWNDRHSRRAQSRHSRGDAAPPTRSPRSR